MYWKSTTVFSYVSYVPCVSYVYLFKIFYGSAHPEEQRTKVLCQKKTYKFFLYSSVAISF